jgi:cell division protein FtsQ
MGRVKERAINVAPKAGPRFGPGSTGAGSRAPKRDELRPHVHGQTSRRVMRWATAVAGVVAVAAPIYWAVSSGWIVATVEATHLGFLQATSASGFALREVRVEGRGETAVADILRAVQANRGDPILGIDIDGVRQRLEYLPWIETASVERRFPDQLIVSVTEAEPMALWQRSQKLYLVSREGAVIEAASLGKYAKLLIIVGDDAPKKAQDLFDILAQEPELRSHVTAAVLVGKRRWNIRSEEQRDMKGAGDLKRDLGDRR